MMCPDNNDPKDGLLSWDTEDRERASAAIRVICWAKNHKNNNNNNDQSQCCNDSLYYSVTRCEEKKEQQQQQQQQPTTHLDLNDGCSSTTTPSSTSTTTDSFSKILASLLVQTKWSSARDLQWYTTRCLTAQECEEDNEQEEKDEKEAVAGVDASISVICRDASGLSHPDEEEHLAKFLKASLWDQLCFLEKQQHQQSPPLAFDDISVEILLTAPGYIPMVEKRYTTVDLMLQNCDDSDMTMDVAQFHDVGVAICSQAVQLDQLCNIQSAVKEFIHEVELCFETHHPHINYGTDPFGFLEIASRGGERYDALVNLDEQRWRALRNVAYEDAPWRSFIEAMFPSSGWKVAVSIVYSRPGAKHQDWHCDGRHYDAEAELDGQGHAPPYGVCVFVPLVDLNPTVGFTQFFLKSHKTSRLVGFGQASHLLAADFDGILQAGQSVIYDYRNMHRGMANQSTDIIRPVLQFLYTVPSYKETRNYGTVSMYPPGYDSPSEKALS